MRKAGKATPAVSEAPLQGAGRHSLPEPAREVALTLLQGGEQVRGRMSEPRIVSPFGGSALRQSEAETRWGRRGDPRESH